MSTTDNDIIFLDGRKIYLRSPEKSDIPLFVRWINDERIRKFLTVRKPISTDKEEEIVKRFNTGNNVHLVICEKTKRIPVGSVSYEINWINRRAELGIMIGEVALQGKGYGEEAMRIFIDYGFKTLNMHKIVLEVYAFNERAVKLYGKLGFKTEGVFKEHSYKEGKYHDLLYMGLIDRDWK